MVLQDHVEITSPFRGAVIRWNFSEQREVGQFANGDWWVQGPVTVTSITPFEVDGDRHMSGTMLNPDCVGGQGSNGRDQGYDSTMYGQYGVSPQRWQPALCENLQLPKQYPAGSSLVSTVTNPSPGETPQVQFSACLTVVAVVPAPDSFRPPYCPGDPTIKAPQWTSADLDLSKLVNRFSWAQYMEPERPYAQTLSRISVFAIDHARGFMSRFALAEEGLGGYGRDYAGRLGNAIMGLCSDLGTTQKRDLAVQLVQKGIDTYYQVLRGHRYPADGGQMCGRKFPVLLAGLLLDEQGMLDVGRDYLAGTNTFQEDGQTFFVEETSPGVYNFGDGGYDAGDVGMPEWGNKHAETTSLDRKQWDTGLPAAVRGDPYRVCCTANVSIAPVFAALALGLRGDWNHEPFFDYQDRFMDTMPNDPYTTRVYPDWNRSYEPPHEDIWDAFRAGLHTPSGGEIGGVRFHNDNPYQRRSMTRVVQPVAQGVLPDENSHIVTNEGEYVSWRPLQTESSDYATWPDGSVKYAECWVPTTMSANELKIVYLSVDNTVQEPAFELHPDVAAELGTLLTGGTASGWSWRCDIDQGTPRSGVRVLGQHGDLDVVFSNANCVRLRWKVRSTDGNYVWEHRFEFYRGVPYGRYWSLAVFSNDQITDRTDYLAVGCSIAGNQCWPQVEDFFKFRNPDAGSFSGWNRIWGGAGNIGDGQGMGVAHGALLFIDPANPGSASPIDVSTVRSYDRGFGYISEEAVSINWGDHQTFGPLGHVPRLPQQFGSEQQAIDASIAQARDLRDNIPLGGHSPNRMFIDFRVQPWVYPRVAGSQADHGVSKYHSITTLGVPTLLHALRRGVSQEWCRGMHFYETGNFGSGPTATVDMEIVSARKHQNLSYWDSRPFESDLLGKLERNLPGLGVRCSNILDVNIGQQQLGPSSGNVVAGQDIHYIYNGGGSFTMQLPASTSRNWVVIENEATDGSVITVATTGGFTVAAPTSVRPGEAFFYSVDGSGDTEWNARDAYVPWSQYDRQHVSFNLTTHYFLMTGDPMAGVHIDHYREILRGSLRPFGYPGGNFTIMTWEQDRELGRGFSAAAWIESEAPDPTFVEDMNARWDTSYSTSGLSVTPQNRQLWGGLFPNFRDLSQILAPGHDLRGLNTDSSTVSLTPAALTPSMTPWQIGLMMAGAYAWWKVSGNDRALELTKIQGEHAIDQYFFEDRQEQNGSGRAGGGWYNMYHGIKFRWSDTSTPGEMPPPSQLPPAVQYERSNGGKGPDLGDGTAAFRVWVGFQRWIYPAPAIVREILINEGRTNEPLFDKCNAILRGWFQTYYAPMGSAGQWAGPSDHDLDWTTVVPDVFSQNYGGGGGTQNSQVSGIGPNVSFGNTTATLSGPQSPGDGGIVIVRGR